MTAPSYQDDATSLPIRPRRNRRTPVIRALVRETDLSAHRLIYPLFVHAGNANEPIDAMPGQMRWTQEGLLGEMQRAAELGIDAFALFPAVNGELKTPQATEAWNPKGLIPQTLRAIKRHNADWLIITDVALDPYNSEGHDGIVSPDGRVLNDESVQGLCKQALCQAEAGSDVVAPSDMMDGRVGAIRAALDANGHEEVAILSYAAKYASALYGPFRAALDSAPRRNSDKPIPADKKTYQMDPANVREAIREITLDELEGADIVMVKPAGAYLDVIRAVRESTTLPVAAYQVSGEYAMIKTACERGCLDEQAVVLETLTGIRRAGADMIFTYFAPRAAQWLNGR